MNGQMLEQAKRLGNRSYQLQTFLDKTTDGEPVYVALIPELPGCHTHGDTEEEALELLNELKVEFIYFMLEDRLAIPEPKNFDNLTSIKAYAIEDTSANKRATAFSFSQYGSSFNVSGATAVHSGRRVYVA